MLRLGSEFSENVARELFRSYVDFLPVNYLIEEQSVTI